MPQGPQKLWHSDYRPGNRARQPGSRSPRQFPVLRILFLAGAAGFLLVRFDALWSLAIHGLRPKEPATMVELPPPRWIFNHDSSRASLPCGPGIETCARAGEKFGAGLNSEIGALHEKAIWRHGLKFPRVTGITLSFRDSGGTRLPELAALEGEEGGHAFRYHRGSAGRHSWCDDNRGCLEDQPAPDPPMQGPFRNAGGWVSMTSEFPEVRPALAGRISMVDSNVPGDWEIVVYHGRELYTHYRNLKSLSPGMSAGKIVTPSGILGWASPTDSSGFSGRFRAEESGMPREIFARADGADHGD